VLLCARAATVEPRGPFQGPIVVNFAATGARRRAMSIPARTPHTS
jgi:hypothetical protein